MLDDRNRPTHTCNEAVAEEVYARLGVYAGGFDALHRRLTCVDQG